MQRTLRPASGIQGTVKLPGDKSISHRYAMLAALAEGRSVLTNYSSGEDCASTLACLRSLGVDCSRDGDRVQISGTGIDGLQPPTETLDAGNSGTTIRLLSGILAGQRFTSKIAGDESLSKRPMQRIMTPLTAMGASIQAREEQYPPLTIRGRPLEAIRYELPVASAQVKSAVLLAGLYASGVTEVVEPTETRNHSEIALRHFGAHVAVDGRVIAVRGRPRLAARKVRIPSDLSSAVFFIGASLLLPDSNLRIEGVGLNPTRTAVLSALRSMGAALEVHPDDDEGGEPVGSLVVRSGPPLEGGVISGSVTVGVIDEVPMLAVLGAVSKNGLRIRDAAELRVKETDRIATVAENLRRMGARVEERADGMDIEGGARLRAAELDSAGDHRIAMAFAVAALAADGECVLKGADAAGVSYPEFFETLGTVVRN